MIKSLPIIKAKPVKYKIARYILTTLAIGVAVPIFLTSPYGLYFLARGAAKHYFRKSDLKRELKRMEKNGYVALTKTKEGWTVRLLKKGRDRQRRIKLEDLDLPARKSWDGKWRFFIFDVPEKSKNKRDQLTKKLKDLEMYHIQRSVFAYPFDCRDELKFISDYYDISKHTTYIESDYSDIERELKQHFKRQKIL